MRGTSDRPSFEPADRRPARMRVKPHSAKPGPAGSLRDIVDEPARSQPCVEVFTVAETGARLRTWLERMPLVADDERHSFECADPRTGAKIRFRPPLLQRIRPETAEADAYLHALEDAPRLQALVLVQAGAAALGLWRGEALLRHQTNKKYVVRGKGRAQPTHLRTKGKSRYGSRLRLRNAAQLLTEVNETLGAWWRSEGAFDEVFHSCPVRIWGELFRTRPPPPFERGSSLVKIPLDVHVPNHAELLRVHERLARGTIEISEAPVAG